MRDSTAIIPLRAGSKGIKDKNRKKMLGRPLFSWVLGEAIRSDLENIYVYTDDEIIIDFVKGEYNWSEKVKVMNRPPHTATDKASTESALLDFAEKVDFDILCLLQATSPLTDSCYIDEGLKLIKEKEFDSALSVVRTHRFIWDENGEPENYDFLNRPRRQDFDGFLVENGAIYMITEEMFQKTENRLGGEIGLIEMPEDTYVEIDKLNDWHIAEKLLEKRLLNNKGSTDNIKSVFFDVDGVFTEGNISNTESGEFLKVFNRRDGMGVELLSEAGIEVNVITSEDSPIVKKRMEKLKINELYLGVKDKYCLLSHLIKESGLSWSEIAYVGDDINDMACILAAGWGLVPYDGIQQMKLKADIILNKTGGNGVVREASEFILNYNSRRNK